MKNILVIIVILIIVGVLGYLAYRFFFKKPEDGMACSSTGGSINDGTIINGVCVKTDNGSSNDTNTNNEPTIPHQLLADYFVNGDDDHDKAVFKLGLECAKAFLYNNTSNEMANAVMVLMGRGGTSGVCNGFNCPLASSISGLNQAQKLSLLNYVNNLNADHLIASNLRADLPTWKRFANLAIGNKNMCSVILEEAVRIKLPGVWATYGRG